jgi:tetratricopeptide (TPR) repeat protein
VTGTGDCRLREGEVSLGASGRVRGRVGCLSRACGWGLACGLLFLGGIEAELEAQQVQSSVAAVQSLIRAKNYDEALRMAKAGLEETPQDFRLWTLEGIVYSIEGQKQEALTAFDRALGLSPTYAAALKGEVQLLYPTKDARAIPLLKRIVSVDPNDGTAHEMLANLEENGRDCEGAVEEFRRSAEVIARHPASLEAYANCLVQRKQPDAAVPVLESLIALLPEQVYPKYDLAVVLVGEKQYDAAIKVLAPVLSGEQADPDLLSVASEAYEGAGDTPKAVALLRQAIVLRPADANLYSSFAALCLNHDSFQVGIDMVDAGIQRVPGSSALYISRGLLYAQLANYDKAEADFNTAEHLDAGQSLSSYARDLAEMQKGQSDKEHSAKAIEEVRVQLRAHPESALLHCLLAKLLTDEGAEAQSEVSQEAVGAALEAVRLKPDLVDARDLLANLYLRAGKYDLAIEQCRAALQYAPTDQGAMYHLVMALRHSKEPGHAEEIAALVKRLSALQQASMQEDTSRKKFRLVEQGSGPSR